MALPVESEKELSVGGFAGIKRIHGLLVNIDVQDPPENWERDESNKKQIVRVDMADTTITEMFGDEEAFELKEDDEVGKFHFFIPYVEPGKKPSQNSIYAKCWLESAKELGKTPSQFIGQYVDLEKQPRKLFDKYVIDPDDPKKKKIKLDAEGKKMLEPVLAVNQGGIPNHFCFVASESAKPEDVDSYIKELVTGLNTTAALRKLIVDQKAKRHPEYRDMLKAGTLAEKLGMVLVEDKFTDKKED